MYKVYLTEEKLQQLCSSDEEVKAAVAKDQPELFAKLEAAAPKKSADDHAGHAHGKKHS
jgi:hypothetical protein